MKKFKRIIAGMLMAGLMVPVASFAQTSNASSVSATLAQIQALQGQIAALQAQQQQNVSTLLTLLKQGSRGDAVKTLQALLAADSSIYPEGNITGFFGPLTAAAVKRFQKNHGLEQVGHVGPKTLKKLNEFLEDNPLSFENSTSTKRGENREREDNEKRPCAIVPPGHLIAPGWLKKHDGERPVVPPCQKLPPGIEKKLESTTTPPFIIDTRAPSISEISVTGIATTTAMVNWHTNEVATGKVYYSSTSPLDFGTALTVSNTSLVKNHLFVLSSLTASTTYYYVLESKDASNNTATTSSQSFVTSN
jgi:peptidoglycan hydrolase-like protein with peptidoglycan-binding domain